MSMTTPITVEKKPVQVTAIHVTDLASSCAAEEWMEDNNYPALYGDATRPDTLRYKDQADNDNTKPDKGWYIDPATGYLTIRTLEGDMIVRDNSWVIMGVEGEFYPCADDIFKQTYTTVSEEESE